MSVGQTDALVLMKMCYIINSLSNNFELPTWYLKKQTFLSHLPSPIYFFPFRFLILLSLIFSLSLILFSVCFVFPPTTTFSSLYYK